MRFSNTLILASFSFLFLLIAGCIGGSGAGKSGSAIPLGNDSGAGILENQAQTQQPDVPQETVPEGATANASAPAPPRNATVPAYVNYCYPTYWKGTLNGTGHNFFEYDRCGDYDYSMNISVVFTVPFDLAAYLARKDFNFNDCPGMPTGAANGSRDISIDGRFNSARKITSKVMNRQDRRPDAETSSSGAMYISQPYGLALATYPRQDAQAAASGAARYPHMVVDRCTWENGLQVLGYDEAMLLGADAGGFALSGGMKTITGIWAMNGTLAGNYTLERTN